MHTHAAGAPASGALAIIATFDMLPAKPSPTQRRAARARAKAIYERIEQELDPRLRGDIIAIEAESGEYFVGPTVGEAAATARTKHPEKPLHFFGVGYPSVYIWR